MWRAGRAESENPRSITTRTLGQARLPYMGKSLIRQVAPSTDVGKLPGWLLISRSLILQDGPRLTIGDLNKFNLWGGLGSPRLLLLPHYHPRRCSPKTSLVPRSVADDSARYLRVDTDARTFPVRLISSRSPLISTAPPQMLLYLP